MDPYIGEIRIFPYSSFAAQVPQGWFFCDGQILKIAEHRALASVIGDTYGGNLEDGTFALPNLIGSAPIGAGQGTGLSNHPLGQPAGAPAVTLDVTQLPPHSHRMIAKSGNGDTAAATSIFLANPAGADLGLPGTRPSSTGNYSIKAGFSQTANTQLGLQSLSAAGGSTPHENRQPFLALLFCIAWQGIFPAQG
jgi:microcystin-dependent protein